uniref:Protein preY, mitochondrial n=1 Tax=Crassostrea virginica TaxID=6565 RepID=A0A8B8EQ00_CRAVI|nr:protein preY, mitochondrial-like isoform X2 [Crassostrea virginica]
MGLRGLSSFLRQKGQKILNCSVFARFSTCNIHNSFDESILKVLVCPVSRKPLRYDKDKSELICDESGIAYPIVEGIPNLVPQDARIINKEDRLQSFAIFANDLVNEINGLDLGFDIGDRKLNVIICR